MTGRCSCMFVHVRARAARRGKQLPAEVSSILQTGGLHCEHSSGQQTHTTQDYTRLHYT